MISKLVTGAKNLFQPLISGLNGTLKMSYALGLQFQSLGSHLMHFLKTPIGAISAITMGIFLLDKTIDGLTTSWEEEVEAAKKAAQVNEENITKYENEIDSLEALQEKLQEAGGDKKALAAIQDELNKAIGATPGLLTGEAESCIIPFYFPSSFVRLKEAFTAFITSPLKPSLSRE